jgi:tetratricopeptide (TPR) repeat protein
VAVNKEKLIAAAQKYVEKGQYDKAIKEYLKVVQDDPKDVRIWLKIGDLHAKKGAAADAVATYERVASTYSEQGFYLKAVAVYKQILKLEPRRVEVNLRLAELYKQLGLLSDAMQQFELAANFFSKEGRTRESLDALKQMVDMEPENVASRIKLAESFSKEGMNEQAVAEFRRAADALKAQNRTEDYVKVAERLAWHKPEDQDLAKELATLYIRRSDPRRALTKLQQCFKADPRDVVTLELLAESFQALGQHQKTLSVLKELAKVQHENGNVEQRNAVYKRILDMEPEDAEARQALGVGRRPASSSSPPQGRPGRATEFVAALPHREEEISREIDAEAELEESDPGGARTPVAVIDAPSAQVEFDEQGVALEEEIEVGGRAPAQAAPVPTPMSRAPATLEGEEASAEGLDEEIARTLTETEVFIKYGLQEKAIEHLSRIFERDPGNIAAHEKLKDLYVAGGRYNEAVDELVWLADTTRDTRPEDAAQYLREALDLDPTHGEARQLLVELTGSDTAPPQAPETLEGGGLEAEEALAFPEPIEGVEMENVGIEVEEPVGAVISGEFDEDVSSAIELAPDEIEFEDEEPSADPSLLGGPGGPLGGPLGAPHLSADAQAHSEIPEEALQDDSLRFGHFGGAEAEEVEEEIVARPLSAAEAASETAGLEDELEEADFFVQQGLADQARELLEDLLGRHPGHPLVLAKLRDLGGAVSELHPTLPEPLPDPVEGEEREGVLELSRRAVVENAIGAEDFETHRDLGIAYKEMGLNDDAIQEFKMVMKAPGKEIECHILIGQCYSEKGMQSEAISQFKKALYVEGISEREQLSLYYELGVAYERLDDWREALYYFEKVSKKDARFRDVEKRVPGLKGRLSSGAPAPVGGNGGAARPTRGANGNGAGNGAAGAHSEEIDLAFDSIVGDEAET